MLAGGARVVWCGAALAYGAATVAVVAANPVPTSHPSVSTTSAVADLAAGLGLLAVGVWSTGRRAGSLGPLTVALGVAWLAPDWVGWMAGHPALRSVAAVAEPFVLPLLVHLVTAFPDGRVTGRGARVLVAAAYGGTAAVTAGRALVLDPFLDPACWSNCSANVFLVRPVPDLAGALGAGWDAASLLVALLVTGSVGARLAASTPTGRRMLWPVLLAAAGVAVVWAVRGAVRLPDPPRDPLAPGLQVLFQAQGAALTLLAAALAWSALREERTRRALTRLAGDLAEADGRGRLAPVLARALGDPTVQVGYWLPPDRGYVDVDGRPLVTPRGPGRAVTTITRHGEPVARVVHDPSLGRVRGLASTIGSAARLAVDNERLMAEVRAHLDDLRASCTRIVAAGDAARARWERDLHDGAQQRLFALAHELRRARADAEGAGDRRAAQLLDEAVRAAGEAAESLRRLAHGLYPPLLTDAGLGPALQALTDEAPLPVVLSGDVGRRPPQPVERAAYLLVSEAIGIAGRAGADHVEVGVRRARGALRVTATPLPVAPDGSVVDHVAALGGRLRLEGDVLTAEVPCG